MSGTQSPQNVSTKLQRIARLARERPDEALTTLSHYIDHEWLLEAYRRTRKGGATGVDRMTAERYAESLEANLDSLLNRFKAGSYRAPPVRRVEIPKGDGKTRPIGIPTIEDKILQRAVAMVLEAVYEQEFRDFSYGFRPGRSPHTALQDLWAQLMPMRGGWVLEVDVEGFFDHLDHGHLRRFLDRRIRDGVLRRSIDKWLKAGILEEGVLWRPGSGTPQGGVVSPILANIYLHEVLDSWLVEEVMPRLRGPCFPLRYADDFVLIFPSEEDARKVMNVLPLRFAKFGLRLHPEKTRLLDFRHPWRRQSQGKLPTFNLLGFTHHWGKSLKGNWVVKRRTMAARFSRATMAVARWCQMNRHRPIDEQHRRLTRMLQGHYAYYGLTGNAPALVRFRDAVERIWRKWLDRRSQRARMSWTKFQRLKRRYPLPRIRVVHSMVA